MNQARTIAFFAIAAALAACSESSMAPAIQAPESTQFAAGGGATTQLSVKDTIRFSITIDPSRNVYYDLGAGNSLVFPSGSLCDLNSSYGDKEWHKSCKGAKAPLTVNVMAWLDKHGHARIDFDKHVRFVPSTNPAKWVMITFADLEAANNSLFNIDYCPSKDSKCKDESDKDPSLAVTRDPVTGKVYRRIKHFSGYNVAAGRFGGDENAAPSATSVLKISALSGFATRSVVSLHGLSAYFSRQTSGYILAAGQTAG